MSDAHDPSLAPSDRDVSFLGAFALFFGNYANFLGRSSRGAFWWWVVWAILLSAVFGVLDFSLFSGGLPVIGGVFFLLTVLPAIAISVRRLHDIGRTGWWLLIGLAPVVGILLLIFFYAQPGQRRANVFGPDREAGR